jgi:hypothetical protein
MKIKNNTNLYDKKITKESKIVPLKISDNTFNKTKHFPSTTREWYNSIYVYNNSNNSLFFNKNLITLIKGYFFMYYNKTMWGIKNRSVRLRRLSMKRIFISKIGLKHTNKKVTINVHIYNEEKRILIQKLSKIMRLIFSIKNKNSTYKSAFDILRILDKQKMRISFIKYLNTMRNVIIAKLNYQKKLIKSNNISLDKTTVIVKSLLSDLHNINKMIISYDFYKESYKDYNNNIYGEFLRKFFLEKEIRLLNYYKLLLVINKNKFKSHYLSKLKVLLSKIFNKEIELNIINQKYAHLNSDIFTEALTIKLRKRKNRLLKTMKNFFNTFKVPAVNKIKSESMNEKNFLLKKVDIFFNKNLSTNDLLNELILDDNNYSSSGLNKEIENKYLNNLKYKQVVGIRIEAKGRLTQRLTASRSVFKVKWKGSIRNIDSSYKGMSSVNLRGFLSPNIQYSSISSTTRNGAFGIKGWMSGN